MNAWSWFYRHVCPSCVETKPADPPALQKLEESASALDRVGEEIRNIRRQMAGDRNPLLGDQPRRQEGGR